MAVKRAVIALGMLLSGASAPLALRGLRTVAWLRVDWTHLTSWAATTPLEDAVAAIVRLVALICMYWLLGSSALYGLARLTRLPRATRVAGWITMPVVRRVVDRALAVALATSTVVAGWVVTASAAAPQRGPVILTLATTPTSSTPTPPLPAPPVTTPTSTPSPSPAPTLGYVSHPAANGPRPGSAFPTQPTSPNPSQEWTTHHVVPGDNLWKIAAEHLADVLALDSDHISNRRIAIYWLRVVSVNRASLSSGDPNLIHPGEIVKLPPIVQPSEGGG